MRFGTTILEQAEILGAITQDEGRVTRIFLSREHRRAGEQIKTWMLDAGMQAEFDALGNVVGRYAAQSPDAPLVLTGSHMDTVVNAGKYDGLFGILTAIACVKDLHARGKRLPYTLEVIAFADEEGVRFGVSMMGSKAIAGKFDAAMLQSTDANGISMRDALSAFGGDPEGISALRREPEKIKVFIESHIEQGPVLLNAGLPVGVVTSIAGTTRVRVKLAGLAGHAGTVPMTVRHDALTAASEMVLAVERYCKARADELVGTVGKLAIPGGGAINVIPGNVEFSVDLRSGDDAKRMPALAAIEAECRAIAKRRGVEINWEPILHLAATPCAATQQEALAASIQASGIPVHKLPSGAGHDAMQFDGVAPLIMLFVRCGNGGISHNPLETMTAEDADTATAVLLHYLEHLS
jgi:N-carbamoyl-L-amino-acid hydrolase